MASSLIGALRVSLGLDTAQFESGAAKAKARAKDVSSSIEQSFNGAKRAIEGLFAAFTVGLLTDQIKKSLDYAGSLAEVSKTLGVTTKDLQTFRFAASQSGVAQDQLEVGLRRLTVSMGKAELGSKAQAKAFQAIGISVDQLKGKNTGDVFRLMADGLSKVSDRSQRAAIEMTLMGRSGSTLDNLLAPGAQRLNALAEAAQRLGIVLSDQQIQGAEETAHKLDALKQVLEAQIASVVASNSQAIYNLASAIASLTGSVIRFLNSNPQHALELIGAMAGGALGARFGPIGALAGGALGAAAGSYLGTLQSNANPSLDVRTQQMWQAQREFAASQRFGVSNVARKNAAEKFWEQIQLLRGATASSRAQTAAGTPQRPGTNLPQFLAGDKKPKKAPKDKNEQDEFQFEQAMRQTDLQILEARKSLSHDIAQQAEISLQALDVQKQIADAEVDHKVAQAGVDLAAHKIEKSTYDQIVADAAIAKSKEDQLTRLQRQKILDDRDEALLRESIDLDSHGYDIQKSMLQKQADLAQTASERRAIELQLLDLQYKEQRIMLERIVNESKNADEVDKANQDLAALAKNYQLDRANVLQQTRGPFQQYLDSLPTTSAKWTEALQQVAVDGFGAISDSADEVAGKIIKIGGIVGNVTRTILADLLKIELQKFIIAPLANALGGVFGGGSSTFAPGGGGFTITGTGSGVTPGVVPAFATGGGFTVLGNRGVDRNMLSLNGLPIAQVSHGERISVGSSDHAAAGRQVVEVVLRDEMLDARITQGSGVAIVRAYPAISAGIMGKIADQKRRQP